MRCASFGVSSEEEEDAGVKCVRGNKSAFMLLLWIRCFLFIVTLDSLPMEIANLWPLIPAEQKHILQMVPYCSSVSSHDPLLIFRDLNFTPPADYTDSTSVVYWDHLKRETLLGCCKKFTSEKLWINDKLHNSWPQHSPTGSLQSLSSEHKIQK